MATRTTTPAEWLDLLIRKAPALRDAGVKRIDLKGVVVELTERDAPAVADTASDEEHPDMMDPLEDPSTYGGRVPSFRRQRGEV
jgi:hypothetical protein